MTIRGRLFNWWMKGVKKSYSIDWLAGRISDPASWAAGDTLTKPMEQHPTVYAIVQLISQNLAAVPTVVIADEDAVYDTPLQQLLNNPNPLETGYSLMEKTAMYLSLSGEAFWVLVDSKGMQAGLRNAVPAQIWCVPPKTMTESVENGVIIGWEYHEGGKKLYFEPEQVLHFKKTNPYNAFRGLSPISAARMTMETDSRAQKFQKSFYDNDASPGGVVSIPGEPGVPIDPDVFKQYKAQFEARHQGAINARKVAILSEGVTYTPTPVSFVDAQYLESRRMNRDELCQIWLVPKTMIGATEELNYATASVQKRQFYENCLMPLMKLVEIRIQRDLYDRFQPGHDFEFDLSTIEELKANQELISQLVDTYFRIGVPMSALIEAYELPFDPTWEGVDDSHIPTTLKTVGEEPPEPVVPPTENPPPPPEENLIEQEAFRALIKNKLKRYFFDQRTRVIKSYAEKKEDIWENEDSELLKLLQPVLEGLYRDYPELVDEHLKALTTLNNSFKRQITEEAAKAKTEDEITKAIKNVYNNASFKANKIADAELERALAAISAIRN